MSAKELSIEVEDLQRRLAEAEDTLRTIRGGEVDAVVVSGPKGQQVYVLQSAEEPYRIFLETMREGTVTLMADATIAYCNKAFSEILKTPLEHLIGSALDTLVAPDHGDHLRRLLEQGRAGNVQGEIQFAAGDGSVAWVNLSFCPGKAQEADRIFLVANDISERKRAEESLRASEISYRRLFESAQDGILLLDADTSAVTDVNPSLIALIGYTREELLGKTLWEIGPFRDTAASTEILYRLQRDGHVRYGNLPLKTKSGVAVHVEFVANSYLAGRRKVIQCNIRDVTARTQAEELKGLLASIVESSSDAIIGVAPDGKIVSWNHAAELLYGYGAGEVVGKPVSFLWPPEPWDEGRYILDRIMRGESAHLESVRVRKDGSRFDVSLTVSPIRNAAGEATGAAEIIRDITELRKTRAELALRNRIADIFLTAPDKSVSGEVLRAILDATGSSSGVFGRLDEAGALVSSSTGLQNEWAEITALGGRAFAEGRPVRANRILAVPILCRGKGVGQFTVASEANDYKQTDQDLLERIADYVAPVLHARMERIAHETALTNALADKLVLLQEVHHRVKNNLQTISSLLNLQAESVPEEARKALETSQRRVRAMALVHEQLYSREDLGDLDFAEYTRTLTTDLFNVCKVGSDVRLRLEVEPLLLGADQAIPCGLILNELVNNALKHAFSDSRAAEVLVEVESRDSGLVTLRVADNGIGLPAGFDWQHAASLGLRIVTLLTHQLKGALHYQPGGGCDFSVTFARRAASVPVSVSSD
ncbi:MAG TPA: PAS domain S-box protein [Bryobacteraceae bacterium]|nr:PAS domain S-box protein [Bryobacteraceae bacterium]